MAREPYVPCPVSGRDCRTAWRQGKFKKNVWQANATTAVRIEPSAGTTIIFHVAASDKIWTLYVEDETLPKKHKKHKEYWNG
jgi:hypothetical protein